MSLFVERRRPAFTRDLVVRVGLAWGLIAILLIVTNLPAILALRFPDPDDTLRLIEVRDLIAGQNWFDATQYRIDAPGGGVPMHWSRLVDLPIAAVIVALRGILGTQAAETVALVGIPLLTLGAALLLAGRIAWRLIDEEAAGFACLAMALSVPLIHQLRPMRIDHHGWQIVCALAAVNALMARNPRQGGWAAGLALATWLAISIEGLPLVAAICAVVALRWLRDWRQAAWLTATLQGLALGSAAIFAATRGLGALVEHCDAISPAHLAAFATAAGLTTLLGRAGPRTLVFRLGGLAVVGACAVGALLAFAPQCAAGAFAEIDPLVARFWYQGVAEGLPMWRQEPDLVMQSVVPPAIALVACLRLAGTSSGWLRQWWHDYALMLAAALAISVLVARAGAVAGALAAVPLGWQVRGWLRSSRKLRRPGKRALALAAIALALAPAMPLTLLTFASPVKAAIGAQPAKVSSCAIAEASPSLDRLPTGEILAPLDIGPQLLYGTHHTVVATGHHRGQAAMRTVIETFTGAPEAARLALAARGTRYLAVCPDLGEPARYAAAAPRGLMAALLAGRAPAWLEPVQLPGHGALKVWRLRH